VLGAMIGSALVGTFMGVLLAYGIVAPLAGRLKQVLDQDAMIYQAVKQVIVSSLHGWPQPLVVESARSGLGHAFRPGLRNCSTRCAVARGSCHGQAAKGQEAPCRSSSRRSPWPAAITAAPGKWPMPIS
jgi:hypothetical protein